MAATGGLKRHHTPNMKGKTMAKKLTDDPYGKGGKPTSTKPKSKTAGNGKTQEVQISPPNFEHLTIKILGTAPLVQNKFSEKAREQMKATQEAGSTARGKKTREPKDFQKGYEQASHVSREGWYGIPASAFRNAMVSACRIVGFQMTRAKLALFIDADGFDASEGTPLVKITKGKPHYAEHYVRNETGVVDLRPRPMWDEGWEASVTICFDADMFTKVDVANLIARAGVQVGVCEGRPDSKKSCGMGWGTFRPADKDV
jgi:hypothetical protein